MTEQGIDGLTPHQQLIFWTGAIVQNDVHLETGVRTLGRLAAFVGGPFPGEPARGFGRLLDEVKPLIWAGQVPDDLKQEIVLLLGEVRVVHRERERFAHDIWMRDEDSGDFAVANWVMGRVDRPAWGPSQPISEFEAIARR